MFVRQRLTLGLAMILGLIGWMAVPMPAQSGAQPQSGSSSIVDSIRFREIGPTRQGGRYVEFAVVESNPRVFYAATATGGLWKTENNGVSFTSVFDNQPDFALGAVALAQSRLGKYDDAFKSFARAGGELNGRMNTAALLERAGRDEEALKHYEAARRLEPSSASLLRRLVEMYERTGRRGQAETARHDLNVSSGIETAKN